MQLFQQRWNYVKTTHKSNVFKELPIPKWDRVSLVMRLFVKITHKLSPFGIDLCVFALIFFTESVKEDTHMKVVIIGGVAGGATATARIRRLDGFDRLIPIDELRDRINELDIEKPVYIVCQSGLRSYIASLILAQEGFECYSFAGGYKFYECFRKDRLDKEGQLDCGVYI